MTDEREYEPVYTGAPYYGWPRAGVASFRGVPYYFECVFDELADDYSNVYLIRSLDEETLRLELELWDIFLRWRRAADAGRVAPAQETVLPEDIPRRAEIWSILTERRSHVWSGALTGARAEFKQQPGWPSRHTGWIVRWLPLGNK
jgi:hypothetical protein